MLRSSFIILIAAILITPSLAAIAEFSLAAEGIGSLSINNGENWNAGTVGAGFLHSGDQYNGGSSGDHLISGHGQFQYQDTSTLDATINNRYTQSGSSEFHNGVLFENTLGMEDASANVTDQHVNARYGGYLTETRIDNAKFVNNANLSVGQQAEWNGVGHYYGEVNYGVTLGTGGNNSQIDYINEGTKRFDVVTNESGGGRARPQFRYVDFSDSYFANMTGKELVAMNATAANEAEVNNTSAEEA